LVVTIDNKEQIVFLILTDVLCVLYVARYTSSIRVVDI